MRTIKKILIFLVVFASFISCKDNKIELGSSNVVKPIIVSEEHTNKEIDIHVIEVNRHDKRVDYSLEIINITNKPIILPELNSTFFHIQNSILYIELYSHDENITNGFFFEPGSVSEYVTLQPKEKIKITNEIAVVWNKENENRLFSERHEYVSYDFDKVCFLIGYINKNTLMNVGVYDNFGIPCSTATLYQEINGILPRYLFLELSLTEQLDYILSKCNYYSDEHEIVGYCTLFVNELKEQKSSIDNIVSVIINKLDNSQFIENNQRRNFTIDNIMYIYFLMIFQNNYHNLVDSNRIELLQRKLLIKYNDHSRTIKGNKLNYRYTIFCMILEENFLLESFDESEKIPRFIARLFINNKMNGIITRLKMFNSIEKKYLPFAK